MCRQIGIGLTLGLVLCAAAAAAEPANVPLEYRWEDGYLYSCSFRVSALVENKTVEFVGAVVHLPISDRFIKEEDKEPIPEEGMGTGYVIKPEGIMVTCAHVVHQAVKITAHFGDKTYPVEVLHYDAGRDLAILKVDAKSLPTVPFLDSKHVQLAQEIRVVGYPLSDVLGESIKMSRGTISGISNQDGESRFQVDARINPGNSGGPIVDEQGRVVGMASEMLSGESIDSVGFAIPSSDAMAFLRENGIEPPVAPDGEKLDGPALARRVTPAVALLKTKMGPGGVGAKKRRCLSFSANCQLRVGNQMVASLPLEQGTLVVDPLGEVGSSREGGLVPLVFQGIGTLGIEHLPGSNRKKWSSRRCIVVRPAPTPAPRPTPAPAPMPSPGLAMPSDPWADLRSRFPGIGPPGMGPPGLDDFRLPHRRLPFGPALPPFGPRGGEDPLGPGGLPTPPTPAPPAERPESRPEEWIPIMEEIEYQRLPPSADGAVPITKKVRVYSVKKGNDGKPAIDMNMEGTLTWNPEVACVTKSDMKGQISLVTEIGPVRVPLAMAYQLDRKKRNEPTGLAPGPGSRGPRSGSPSVVLPPKATLDPRAADESTPSTSGLDKFNPED